MSLSRSGGPVLRWEGAALPSVPFTVTAGRVATGRQVGPQPLLVSAAQWSFLGVCGPHWGVPGRRHLGQGRGRTALQGPESLPVSLLQLLRGRSHFLGAWL